jgi:hypothetical protein
LVGISIAKSSRIAEDDTAIQLGLIGRERGGDWGTRRL